MKQQDGYRVQCPSCKNVTAFLDDRENDEIECLHCRWVVVISESLLAQREAETGGVEE